MGEGSARLKRYLNGTARPREAAVIIGNLSCKEEQEIIVESRNTIQLNYTELKGLIICICFRRNSIASRSVKMGFNCRCRETKTNGHKATLVAYKYARAVFELLQNLGWSSEAKDRKKYKN